jgi:hypothetical protein
MRDKQVKKLTPWPRKKQYFVQSKSWLDKIKVAAVFEKC